MKPEHIKKRIDKNVNPEIQEIQNLLRKNEIKVNLKKTPSLSETHRDSIASKEISDAVASIVEKVTSNIINSSDMIVSKPFYPKAKSDLLNAWKENFSKLRRLVEFDIDKISAIILQAHDEGWNGQQLERIVRSELPPEEGKYAADIARTGSSMLNTAISLATYKEIGVKYYVWMATMDERVRPEHAMMNGLICSTTDSTVWYEENPDDPLHPIEHKRDDTMVKLHPGEDLQCRCSMVMWDPEIDGKYEIKKH